MATAIIIGVGPVEGLGAQLALNFSRLDLEIVVAGRTRSKLETVVELISADGGSARACVADATDESQVQNLFDEAGSNAPVQLAIYNAGNSTPGNIMEMETDFFRNSWESITCGGFLFAREACRRMVPYQSGTIIFTGASASLRGKPGFGAFNSAKAGLRTMAQALAKEVGPEGIHVAHVIIDGIIDGDKIRERAPEFYDSLGEAGRINLQGIVDAYEYLYKQDKNAWSFELDLRTAIESW